MEKAGRSNQKVLRRIADWILLGLCDPSRVGRIFDGRHRTANRDHADAINRRRQRSAPSPAVLTQKIDLYEPLSGCSYRSWRTTMPRLSQPNNGCNSKVTPRRSTEEKGSDAAEDEVTIGIANYKLPDDYVTSSYADLAKTISGIKFLVRPWVPYGMLTGLVAEPKVGKSSFALWSLIAPLITGRSWFTGLPGPKPGYVLYCDTERSAAVNIDRMKRWGSADGSHPDSIRGQVQSSGHRRL